MNPPLILCRHDQMLERGCMDCLAPEDWRIETEYEIVDNRERKA